MNYFEFLINKSISDNKVISVCLKKIDWNKRHIGYVRNYKDNVLTFDELNELGLIKKQRELLISEIKSIELGGEYNDDLEKAYNNELGKKQDKTRYKDAKDISSQFLTKLKNEKVICSFFFNDGFFSIGILEDFSEDQLFIKNISYNGTEDGFSTFYSKSLTRIRTNSSTEIMAKFLYDNNNNTKIHRQSLSLSKLSKQKLRKTESL